jgi:LysR family glycine cleavage system transcriptional activator
MISSRRFLPSISLLTAFEAAARSLSFTLAAQELDLTQSAVSRQIKALEEQLGVALFARERQKVRLTAAGETYVRDVRAALSTLASASIALHANPGGGMLDLAILPTFGARWLAPRLAGFLDRHPGITIHFSTRLKPFSFANEHFDAAVHFGRPDWPDTKAVFLMEETVIPACAPAFADRYGPETAAGLAEAPLIHLSSRPDAWRRWFTAHGLTPDLEAGMVFDQFATAAQAARHGLGVALLPEFLIERELAEGDLVPAMDAPQRSEEAYYLVCPNERAGYPPLVAFRQWLVAEAGGD